MPVPKAQNELLDINIRIAESRPKVPSCLVCRHYRLRRADTRWKTQCDLHDRRSKLLEYINYDYWNVAENNAVDCDDFDGLL